MNPAPPVIRTVFVIVGVTCDVYLLRLNSYAFRKFKRFAINLPCLKTWMRISEPPRHNRSPDSHPPCKSTRNASSINKRSLLQGRGESGSAVRVGGKFGFIFVHRRNQFLPASNAAFWRDFEPPTFLAGCPVVLWCFNSHVRMLVTKRSLLVSTRNLSPGKQKPLSNDRVMMHRRTVGAKGLEG